MQIENIQMASPVLWDGLFVYWASNGTAISPLSPLGGFVDVQPNPIDALRGPVFLLTGSYVNWDDTGHYSTISVYNQLGNYSGGLSAMGGSNPSAINEFHVALHLTPVPEPATATLLVVALGIVGPVAVARRRWRRSKH